jgi:hypothetical protein
MLGLTSATRLVRRILRIGLSGPSGVGDSPVLDACERQTKLTSLISQVSNDLNGIQHAKLTSSRSNLLFVVITRSCDNDRMADKGVRFPSVCLTAMRDRQYVKNTSNSKERAMNIQNEKSHKDLRYGTDHVRILTID